MPFVIKKNSDVLKKGSTVLSINRLGNGVKLDGTNDFISIPDHVSLRPSSISIAINFICLGNAITVVGSNPNATGFLLFKQNTRSTQFEAYAINARPGAVNAVVTSSAGVQRVVSASISAGSINHLVVTANNIEMKMYLDGELIQTIATGFSLNHNTNPLYIGKTGQGVTDGFFNGIVHNLKIINRIINQDEVTKLYKSDNRSCDTILEVEYSAKYEMDEREGDIIQDKSTYSNTGTCNNMNTTIGSNNQRVDKHQQPIAA